MTDISPNDIKLHVENYKRAVYELNIIMIEENHHLPKPHIKVCFHSLVVRFMNGYVEMLTNVVSDKIKQVVSILVIPL